MDDTMQIVIEGVKWVFSIMFLHYLGQGGRIIPVDWLCCRGVVIGSDNKSLLGAKQFLLSEWSKEVQLNSPQGFQENSLGTGCVAERTSTSLNLTSSEAWSHPSPVTLASTFISSSFSKLPARLVMRQTAGSRESQLVKRKKKFLLKWKFHRVTL